MLSFIVTFIPRAIVQAVPLLLGCVGETLNEKSGSLNLGIPGVMYVGGISGVIGAFLYEQSAGENFNGFIGVLIPMLACLLGSLLMGLLFCFLTVTLRANQNVTGLAMTTFGVGIGNGFLKQVAASESDLVFGLVSEEMGVIVAFTLAVAVGAMFIYARAITTRSRSTFYSISACCAAGLFVVQLSLNVFGATDVLPLTGVTFPFVSAGGSSIMSCWGLVAFIKAADERTYSVKR